MLATPALPPASNFYLRVARRNGTMASVEGPALSRLEPSSASPCRNGTGHEALFQKLCSAKLYADRFCALSMTCARARRAAVVVICQAKEANQGLDWIISQNLHRTNPDRSVRSPVYGTSVSLESDALRRPSRARGGVIIAAHSALPPWPHLFCPRAICSFRV
jgi:hypothetical protein